MRAKMLALRALQDINMGCGGVLQVARCNCGVGESDTHRKVVRQQRRRTPSQLRDILIQCACCTKRHPAKRDTDSAQKSFPQEDVSQRTIALASLQRGRLAANACPACFLQRNGPRGDAPVQALILLRISREDLPERTEQLQKHMQTDQGVMSFHRMPSETQAD